MEYLFIYGILLLVELCLVFLAYLIREYWYVQYGDFWDCFFPFVLMTSLLCTAMVIWLFSTKFMVNSLDFLVSCVLSSFSV